jgi:hypothetical protein
VSPGEGKKVAAIAKRSRKGEPTYAEACGRSEAIEESDRDRSGECEGWRMVERRRRERRGPQGPPSASARDDEKGDRVGGRRPITARRRKEAILIKVEEGREWLEIYKKIMAAKNTIEGATGVRRTRAGNILIEFDRKVEVNEVAEKVKAAINDTTEVSALLYRTTMQIRNIDPLTTKNELVEDMRRQWGIVSGGGIEMKSLKMNLEELRWR